MKNWSLGFIIVFSLFMVACDKDSDTTADPIDEPVSNKQKATDLLMSLASGDTAIINKYISANNYTQHNPAFADGRQSLIDAVLAGTFNNMSVDIKRVFVDANLVALHSAYLINGAPMVGFDVFRFEDGLIVEHWDNLQAEEAPNASGHSMLDGPTEIMDAAQTEANRTIAGNFVKDVMIDTNYALMADFLLDGAYTQHNPMMKDSLSGMVEMMEQLREQGITYKYETLHQTVAEGNFVLTISEGAFGDPAQPTAFYDLFRLENGKIVEHWDVMQVIPPADDWANDNGKF
ncbi:MAG: SnoaL-like domain-containing protein [Saprospiraceae bacterium]|nr:SnoaL-like domain-containing protein [Saprospiraceae bacterium]